MVGWWGGVGWRGGGVADRFLGRTHIQRHARSRVKQTNKMWSRNGKKLNKQVDRSGSVKKTSWTNRGRDKITKITIKSHNHNLLRAKMTRNVYYVVVKFLRPKKIKQKKVQWMRSYFIIELWFLLLKSLSYLLNNFMNVRFDPIRKSIIIKNNYNYTYLIICTCPCVCKVSNFHKNIALKIFQNSISILDTTLLILSVHSNGFSENLLIIEMQSSKSSLFSALHKFEIFPAFLFHCLSCVSVSVSIYFCLVLFAR